MPALLSSLEKVKDGGLKALWLSWTDTSVKETQKRITGLRHEAMVAPAEAYKEIVELDASRLRWQSLSRGLSTPSIYAELTAIQKAAAGVRREMQDLQQLAGKTGWEKFSFTDMAIRIEPYAADTDTPYRMLTLAGIEAKLNGLGVQRLVENLRLRKCATSLWTDLRVCLGQLRNGRGGAEEPRGQGVHRHHSQRLRR